MEEPHQVREGGRGDEKLHLLVDTNAFPAGSFKYPINVRSYMTYVHATNAAWSVWERERDGTPKSANKDADSC